MTLHGGRATVDRPAQRRRRCTTTTSRRTTTGDTFDQSLAKGFVELWGLPSKIAAPRATSAWLSVT